jgi:excisionase family DNA binding protein
MLMTDAAGRRKLSTSGPSARAREHNRGMDTPGLARFLTLADTAELLNITPDEVYGLVKSGELPAIRIGGRGVWRVERAVLESYIEAMYEATRRMGLWNQADFASMLEPAFGQPRTRSAAPVR